MEKSKEEYEIRGPEASGQGVYLADGFLVKKGSLARKETVPSGKNVSAIHQRLLEDGVLEPHGNQYRFTRDHLFSSPSGAAAAVLGRTANGWEQWKLADGRNLSEIRRLTGPNATNSLEPAIREKLVDCHRKQLASANLPSDQRLEREYRLFRDKFGPERLASLDGEALLTFMHDIGNRDSLAYWLEFKNDDEFHTGDLGSIAGGSALKFRIFRRKETGNWQSGVEKGNLPTDITLEKAIEIAKSHREQLVLGARLIEALGKDASDEDYGKLQDDLDDQAPDVSRLSWGHKYFSLLFPSKLDDYHIPELQHFHLIKLLQLPPDGNGRYLCAGRFVSIARELGICLNHLTSVLNALHAPVNRYWRIGTTSGKTGESFWRMMLEVGCVAVGWPNLGDISWLDGSSESSNRIKDLLAREYPNTPSAMGRNGAQLKHFVNSISEGDIILAAEGKAILGVGRVTGGYQFNPGKEFPHRRRVEWVSDKRWELPRSEEGLQKTVHELKNYYENLVEIEKHIQANVGIEKRENGIAPISIRQARLKGIPGRIQSILERKGQVILYGPPGTGKTFWAEKAGLELASIHAFGLPYEALTTDQRNLVVGDSGAKGLVRLCCFHPAYGYEDFLEGYRPATLGNQVAFELRDGIFKETCKDAIANPTSNFYLIVDEINRGDIPRIFGELMTILEKDKRGKCMILPVSRETFLVPSNVFIIGTMNTADRSISLLDTALRRRFGFIELMPDSQTLKGATISGIALGPWLDVLNKRIRQKIGRDARNLQVGHSFLLQGGVPLKDLASLKRVLRDDIIPLLEEYCYEDTQALAEILGKEIVSHNDDGIRNSRFEEGQEGSLVQDLLSAFPEITAMTDTLGSDMQGSPEEESDEESEA